MGAGPYYFSSLPDMIRQPEPPPDYLPARAMEGLRFDLIALGACTG